MEQLDLDALLSQKAELEKKIALALASSRADDLELVLKMIDKHGFTEEDLFSRQGGNPAAKDHEEKKSLPPKYRDPDTGQEWSGRGRTPGWLEGKNKDDYLILKPESSMGEPSE